MELTEDHITEKYAKKCLQCLRKTLLPFYYECTCIACGYNVLQWKEKRTQNSTGKNEHYESI